MTTQRLVQPEVSLAITLISALLCPAAAAQQSIPWAPMAHRFHHLELGPGVIGQQQLLRIPNAAHYYQPVEVRGPKGSQISLSANGGFLPAHQNKLKAGLMMGHVYRFRIGNIPLLEGFEVFPTVELINRLHPPPGMAEKFPIPIELTREELQIAMQGHLVTRVIYLEDPNRALGVRQADEQQYFDVDRRVDPLHMADRLGRPMAILRMGSRVPLGDDDAAFHQNAPPAVVYPEVVETRLDPEAPPSAPSAGEELPPQPPELPGLPTTRHQVAPPAMQPAAAQPASAAEPVGPPSAAPARYPRLPYRY